MPWINMTHRNYAVISDPYGGFGDSL